MSDGATHSTSLTRRAAEWAIIVLFMGALWLPLADNALRLDRSKPLGEKRALAAPPAWGWSTAALDAWPDAFENFYNDHFGFRNFLIRQYYIIKVRWLGVSPVAAADRGPAGVAAGRAGAPELVPRVIVGREDWLFYGRENIVEDWRGLLPVPPEELAQWKKALDERQRWAEGHGMVYVFFVPPNKHSIYPEFLPRWMTKVNDATRVTEIARFVNAHSAGHLLDARPALREAKTLGRLYEKTGTHYNDLGAWAAYRALLAALKAAQPALEPLPLDAYTFETKTVAGKDLATMLGMEDILTEDFIFLTPREPMPLRRAASAAPAEPSGQFVPFAWENPARAGGLRAVMFHDSFGPRIGEFLAHHCARVAMYPQSNFTPEIILAEKPDIIITEMVERTAAQYVPHNFPEVMYYGGGTRRRAP